MVMLIEAAAKFQQRGEKLRPGDDEQHQCQTGGQSHKQTAAKYLASLNVICPSQGRRDPATGAKRRPATIRSRKDPESRPPAFHPAHWPERKYPNSPLLEKLGGRRRRFANQ
jgi:hypothetical protein